MQYSIEIKPQAEKDLKSINKDDATRTIAKIERMRYNLEGDIKKKKLRGGNMVLHPESIIKKKGKKYVLLPYNEFCLIQEMIDDLEDLIDLEHAKKRESKKPTLSLEQVRKKLGL